MRRASRVSQRSRLLTRVLQGHLDRTLPHAPTCGPKASPGSSGRSPHLIHYLIVDPALLPARSLMICTLIPLSHIPPPPPPPSEYCSLGPLIPSRWGALGLFILCAKRECTSHLRAVDTRTVRSYGVSLNYERGQHVAFVACIPRD
jgi:hypothetical protein